MQQVYQTPVDVQIEIESPSVDQAVEAVQQLGQQLSVQLRGLLRRFQIVGMDFKFDEDQVREVPQPDVRFRLFAMDACLTLEVHDNDLTMVSELATDFCEEIGIRLGPTLTQLKIKKHVMDIRYDRIAPRRVGVEG